MALTTAAAASDGKQKTAASDPAASRLEEGLSQLNRHQPLSRHQSSGAGVEAGILELNLGQKTREQARLRDTAETARLDAGKEDARMKNLCRCETPGTLCLTHAKSSARKDWEAGRISRKDMEAAERRAKEANREVERICRAWLAGGREANQAQVERDMASYQRMLETNNAELERARTALSRKIAQEKKERIDAENRQTLAAEQTRAAATASREQQMQGLCREKPHRGMCYCSGYIPAAERGAACGK